MRILLLLLGLTLPLGLRADAGRPHAAALAPADTSFAGAVARLSEPGGYFDTDNLISNEASYLHVVGALRERRLRGGAYLGVGPDQSFSYIAHLRPEVAIIVDIRRDNLLEHLLFKALFELAPDRAAYLHLLLARAPRGRPERGEGIERLVERFDEVPVTRAAFDSIHALVRERVLKTGVALSEKDLATIRRFHGAFAEAGLRLQFNSYGRDPMPYYPTLWQLLTERDLGGRQAGYLASEEAYGVVRALQLADRVIPVVGDLAGGRALPAIADYLRERGLPVTAYYTSNVEQYLAREGKLDRFVENVRRLPRAPGAVVVRSVFRMYHPQAVPGYVSTQLLQPIDSLLAAYDDGRIRTYRELVTVGAVELR